MEEVEVVEEECLFLFQIRLLLLFLLKVFLAFEVLLLAGHVSGMWRMQPAVTASSVMSSLLLFSTANLSWRPFSSTTRSVPAVWPMSGESGGMVTVTDSPTMSCAPLFSKKIGMRKFHRPPPSRYNVVGHGEAKNATSVSRRQRRTMCFFIMFNDGRMDEITSGRERPACRKCLIGR